MKYVNHKDGNKTNNKLSNLELVSPSEKSRHAILLGLCDKPKAHPSVVMKKGKVIKKMICAGISCKDIADFIGVSYVTILRARSRLFSRGRKEK